MVNDSEIRGISHTEENAVGSISKIDDVVKVHDKCLKGAQNSQPPMQPCIIGPYKVNLKINSLHN